ncbi:uncharacterized protein EV420DRAFT_1517021 [Desarmillaria tabescens]|uniref:Uncharacterized protein n=1 Tax=Armillaria tabescens TaxID=1929756 RepID=A0AA39TVG2_ARMTA|nr:uncharacterized protein EV420DRAFT_1517021 [Desarmillaria tabescens]KAK0464579.1 hypothetical protein EV420DRAFT_1517021 [Desarmillaria tabescens]
MHIISTMRRFFTLLMSFIPIAICYVIATVPANSSASHALHAIDFIFPILKVFNLKHTGPEDVSFHISPASGRRVRSPAQHSRLLWGDKISAYSQG